MKKTFYFVRHGESEGNVGKVYQSVDSPLNEKGREQARFLAERASLLSFELIISSPQPRAHETAEIIARQVGKSVEFEKSFLERIKPTNLDGKPHGDKVADDLNREWEKSLVTPGYRVEDGENFDDIISRASRALDYLINRKESRIFVVTHGVFLKAILAHIALGEMLTGDMFMHFQRKFRTANTGLSVIDYDSEHPDTVLKIAVWNDHAHLG